MTRKVFYSFHYQADSWRVAQVRNMGVIEGQRVLNSNEWEDVAKGGDKAIQAWIDEQMKRKSCNIVLIGRQTAGRRWVKYEIETAWNSGKGVIGIYIHNLKDQFGNTTTKGANPFSIFTLSDGRRMDAVVKAYNPSGVTSDAVYNTIATNIEDWVEEAITIRKQA